MTDISTEAVKAWLDSHKHLVGFTNVFTDAEARHMFDMLTALSADRDRLLCEREELTAPNSCGICDTLFQALTERDSLKATVARLCEAAEKFMKRDELYSGNTTEEDRAEFHVAIAAVKETLP